MDRRIALGLLLGAGLSAGWLAIGLAANEDRPAKRSSPLIGRWDLTVQGPAGAYPSWLEIKLSGYRTLVGSYVGQFGSARPIAKIEGDAQGFHFTVPPQWEPQTEDIRVTGRLDGDELRGEVTDGKGHALPWTGRRAPALKRTEPVKWGEPITLFNGKDLTGWKPRSTMQANGWTAQEGLLVNARPGNDLMTEARFNDFQLHAEFRYPAGSNSGIYLRGRYEVQIEDNYGDEPECHKIGGVYGFLTPSTNAARKPGEWQTMDITLVGRVLTVVFNGERVLDRQTIPGITGGALDSDEAAPGPILLQGDHGPIAFRNVVLTPAQ